MTEAANTVGAQFAGAQPRQAGLNAAQMLAGQVKALLLLNTEPEFDSAAGSKAAQGLADVDMVVTLSPFKANMDVSDVLLPIAPFTETSGSFINADGRVQSFHAVVRPLGETRPAWKVLRVLANIAGVPNVNFDSSQEVLAQLLGDCTQLSAAQLSNVTAAALADPGEAGAAPVVASIYQLDSLVRRAPALQHTADARAAVQGAVA